MYRENKKGKRETKSNISGSNPQNARCYEDPVVTISEFS